MKVRILSQGIQVVSLSFLLISASYTGSVSITSTSLIDEIADSQTLFPSVSRAELLSSLNEGNLVSFGETHDSGSERGYLATLYSDLATALNPHPVRCLVETTNDSDLIHAGGSDPVETQFNKICSSSAFFANPTQNYTNELKAHLPEGRVLTHTGYRHTAPYGLMYPTDFDSPQYVDLPEHGSITKQVPGDFAKNGKQMRTHVVRYADDLILERLSREFKTKLAAKGNEAQIISEETARAAHWTESQAFHFQAGEIAHILEIGRVHQSFDYERAYISSINRPEFRADLLLQLLKSPEFAQLVATTKLKGATMGLYISPSPGSSYGTGNIILPETGTIFAFAPNPTKKGASMVVSITPTRGPLLQQSDI